MKNLFSWAFGHRDKNIKNLEKQELFEFSNGLGLLSKGEVVIVASSVLSFSDINSSNSNSMISSVFFILLILTYILVYNKNGGDFYW